jgi:hypothetical protein
VVTDPGGRQYHASSLWSLFALLPAMPHAHVNDAGGPHVRRVPAPPGWHVQAGLVWLAAASAGGTSARVTLPAGDGFTVQATLAGGHPPAVNRHRCDDQRIVVASRVPDELVGSLLHTGVSPLGAS